MHSFIRRSGLRILRGHLAQQDNIFVRKIPVRYSSSYKAAVLTEYGKELQIKQFNQKELRPQEVTIVNVKNKLIQYLA